MIPPSAIVRSLPWGGSYWMYSPIIILGKMLTAIGLLRNTTGAFEVTLVA